MRQAQKIVLALFESKLSIHFVFIFFFLVFFCSPAIFSGIPFSGIFNIIIPGLFFLVCIYAGRWICRRWLLSARFLHFALYSIAAIIAFSVTAIIGLKGFSRNLSIGMIIAIVCVIIGFFLLGTFLSITRTTVLKQIREVTIVKHQRESELQLLRSQLSPHFLFNVLNNLYGLSIRQDQKVPGMILKLSDLLRYSLYDTNHDFVPLTDELDYIANYVELESTRIGEHLLLESNIQKTNPGGIKIAPMLLIVFVENAFKHSKDTLLRDIQIKIGLHISEDNLVFEVRNSFSDTQGKQKTAEDSGIGLAVTMKRLELLYPGRYSLDTSKENGYYTVKLQLKIK